MDKVKINNITADVNLSNLSVKLPDDATGVVLVDVDGNKYYAPIKEGNADVSFLDKLTPGKHNITVTYPGDDKYDSIKNSTVVEIDKYETPMNVTAPSSVDEGENVTVIVKVLSDATGNVIVSIAGKNYTAQVNEGIAIVNISDLAKGNYTADIIYSGDGYYESNNTSADINVREVIKGLVVSAPPVVKYYSGPERFKVTVTKDGNPVVNKLVEISINGVVYNRTTNANGVASIPNVGDLRISSIFLL